MNKRGDEKLVAYFIIALLVVAVLFIVFFTFVGGIHVKEGTCKMKSSVLSIAPTGVKLIVSGLTSCGAVNERIDGNDWSKCTDEIKKQFDDCKGDETCELDAQRECAAYQMAKLAERCWSMYSGSNHFEGQDPNKGECGDYQCFNLEVFDTKQQVDLVARAKKYIIAEGNLKDNFYVPVSCTSTKDVQLFYVDDHGKDQDGVCLKC